MNKHVYSFSLFVSSVGLAVKLKFNTSKAAYSSAPFAILFIPESENHLYATTKRTPILCLKLPLLRFHLCVFYTVGCRPDGINREKKFDLGRHLVPAKTPPVRDTNILRQNGVKMKVTTVTPR